MVIAVAKESSLWFRSEGFGKQYAALQEHKGYGHEQFVLFVQGGALHAEALEAQPKSQKPLRDQQRQEATTLLVEKISE